MQPIEGAVIACAGLGSRLGMGLPKCMIEIGGMTILSRLINSLRGNVPRIHVVVGYREELVIDYCTKHHRDVVIVRNPNYRDTNTAHSLMLGSLGFSKKVLFLDGDLIINQISLNEFIVKAESSQLLVGITRTKSEQAVFVKADFKDGLSEVKKFQRSPATDYEWANIFSGPPSLLTQGTRYVYECIEPYLPCISAEIDLYEIDTPDDLALATIGISKKFKNSPVS
jgi:choline kinase